MKNRALVRVVCRSLFALGLSLTARAADWNQWRGPNRDGIAAGFKIPAAWTAESFVKQWTLVVGEGHSSPVVVGDRVYVFSREDEREVLRCVSSGEGKILWVEASAAPFEMDPFAKDHGKGPKATPTVVDGRVFTLGINGRLSAHEAKTGAVLWRKDFAGEFAATRPASGAAASPLVDGGNVIVHVGGPDHGALTAFDAATGKVNWKCEGDGPGYTSPIVATLGGIRQIITQTRRHCIAVSATDGKLLWKIPLTGSAQNIVTPVVHEDLVIFAMLALPTFAVKATGPEPERIWAAREVPMYMSSPVLNGTTLYGMTTRQRGSLFTLNATTGGAVERPRPARRQRVAHRSRAGVPGRQHLGRVERAPKSRRRAGRGDQN